MKEELVLEKLKDKLKEPEIYLKEAKERAVLLEEYLFSKGLIEPEEFLKIKGEIYQLPIKIFEADERISKQALSKIPEKTAYAAKILPLELVGDILHLGIVDPDNKDTQKVIESLRQAGQQVKIFLISVKDFYQHLEDYYEFGEEVRNILKTYRSAVGKEIEEEKPISLSKEVLPSEEAPIIRLVEIFIRRAVSMQASDIHIEPLPDKSRVRFRLFGDLKTMVYLPKDVHFSIVNRIKVLARLKLDETRIPQDGRFRAFVQGREIDFRIGIFPTVNGEKVAIRILDPLVGLRKLNELGLMNYHVEMVHRNIQKAFGMILVTGPTGSGKTTTLYAFVNELDKERLNIISLEDPVEYRLLGINQSQVRPEIQYTFASGLREILRQDPDVILVGEIRDEETAQLAIHAALTGHIVLSTLHTNSATGAIPRLIDMGVKPYFIPSTVNLVIAQRLVHKLCQDCLVEYQPNEFLYSEIEKEINEAPEWIRNQFGERKFYKGKGCEKCKGKGFVGRIGLFEMFEMTPELGEIVVKGGSEIDIIKKVKEAGFINLRLDGIIKAKEKLVDVEEVFQVA
jgi:type IV pilus assembly protein PilB